MKLFFIKHSWALIVGALIGIIYFLPNLSIDKNFNVKTDAAPLNLEEAFSYGVKIREIVDGHLKDGDPYLWEHKNIFTTWDYYPLALLIGLFYKLIRSTDIASFFVWFDFLGPLSSFLIIYALFWQLTSRRWWSMVSALISLCFPNIFVYTKFFQPTFYRSGASSSIVSVIEQGFNFGLSRLFVPGLTMIFFGIFLISLYGVIKNDIVSRRKIIVAGVAYGLLFYVYFYYWVFASIALVIIGLQSFLHRKILGIKILFIVIIGVVLSVFHWLRYLALSKNPLFKEYLDRVGIDRSRMFNWDSLDYILFIAMLIVFFWLLRRKLGVSQVIYFTSLLATTVIVLNLQVVFGFNVQPDHWGSRVNIYIVNISTLYIIFLVVTRMRKFFVNRELSRVTQGFILLLLIMLGAFGQLSYTAKESYNYGISEDAKAAFQWINNNIPNDAVMVTPAYRSRIVIPLFTHANVYLPMACLSLAGDEEIISRYLSVYKLFKVPTELFSASLIDDDLSTHYRNSIYSEEFESRFSMFCAKFDKKYKTSENNTFAPKARMFSAPVVRGLIARYDATKVNSITDLAYRADFIFWGLGERLVSKLNPAEDARLSMVYKNESIQIFKIIK